MAFSEGNSQQLSLSQGSSSQTRPRNKTEYFDCRYIIKDIERQGEWRQHKAPYQLCISDTKKAFMVRPILLEDDKGGKKDVVAFSEAWAESSHLIGTVSKVGLKKIKITFDHPSLPNEEIITRQFVLSFENVDVQPLVVSLLSRIGLRILESVNGGTSIGSIASFGAVKPLLSTRVPAVLAPPVFAIPTPLAAVSASTPIPTTPLALPFQQLHSTPLFDAPGVIKTTPLSSSDAAIPASTSPPLTPLTLQRVITPPPPPPPALTFPSAPTTRTQHVSQIPLPATQEGVENLVGSQQLLKNTSLPIPSTESHCECKCGRVGCISGPAYLLPKVDTKDANDEISMDSVFDELLGTDDLASVVQVLFGDWQSLSRLAHRLGAIQANPKSANADEMKE
jgi:hypothetical protein